VIKDHSEGTTDRIQLIGIPEYRQEMKKEVMEDDLMNLLRLEKPDLIFLQIDPSRYISR
jgi:hypothetical protein